MNTRIRQIIAWITLLALNLQLFWSLGQAFGAESEIGYPLKEISKLECRFEEFSSLSSSCKQTLPILHTKDYTKYATQNGGYNDYTRIYTVLWGGSYKYGWDVGSGGHQGTDIATAKGTPVYTIANGKVLEAGKDIGWGNYISIQHTINGKKIVSNYAHLSKILVEKGDSVKIGEKIGEVGSTGNSTGNHLHFQIDLPSSFHPYYYDYKECPYSYYEITESGVCFDILAQNTLDPFAFLESNGAILEDIDYDNRENNVSNSNTSSSSSNNTNSSSTSTSTSTSSDDIFDTPLSPEVGSKEDIKKIQRIYYQLGYYSGSISGDYDNIYESIISYQLKTGVISSRSDDGAGYFGPKTRAQTEKDYLAYVNSGGQQVLEASRPGVEPESVASGVTQNTQTISRDKLLTREEIERREVDEFLKVYNISLSNNISHVNENSSQIITLSVKNSKDRGFQGNTPGEISFEYDTNVLGVFPEKFYNFTDGNRDITISGRNAGNTTLKIKIWDVVVKEFSVTVGKNGEKSIVNSARIYSRNASTLGQVNTAVVAMKDQYDNLILKQEFSGNFTISDDSKVLYCVKSGRLEDIRNIYMRKCHDSEFTDTLSFDYSDTIQWVLIFDYKVLSNQTTQLSVKSGNTSLASVKTRVDTPKWLASNYQYSDAIIDTLELWVSSGVERGYFLEDRALSMEDARDWIANTLILSGDTSRLSELAKDTAKLDTPVSREEFLTLAYSYLLKTPVSWANNSYLDSNAEITKKISELLGDYEWQDEFGENYFQPQKAITRWEAAYLLSQTLETQGKLLLARK